MKRFHGVVLLAVVGLLVSGVGRTAETVAPTGVPREVVVTRICDGLLLSERAKKSLTAKQGEELLATLRAYVAEIAPEILPETLDGVADPGPLPEHLRGQQVGQRMDQIIPQSEVVTSNDLALEKIQLKTRLMGILLLAKFQPIYRKTVTPETLAEVRKSIEAFAVALGKHLQAQLVGDSLPFQKDQVEQAVDSLKQRLLAQVGNPISHALTQPVPEAKFDEILAKLARPIEETKRPDGAFGGPMWPAETRLSNITRGADSAFCQQSSDPRLTDIDRDALVPGYTEATREEGILRQEMMRREMEERTREMREQRNRLGGPPRMFVPRQ